MMVNAAEESSMMAKTTQRVLTPAAEACSKMGLSGTTVGKLVAWGTVVDEVGTRRVLVFFNMSMMADLIGNCRRG